MRHAAPADDLANWRVQVLCSFQARGFYHKLGYEAFGELDWSPDIKRIFLQKRLILSQSER